MAEDLALDVEELRHLETKIPETETEEIQLKPEPKGNFCDDIEQEEDASSRVVPGIEERFVDPSLNTATVRKIPEIVPEKKEKPKDPEKMRRPKAPEEIERRPQPPPPLHLSRNVPGSEQRFMDPSLLKTSEIAPEKRQQKPIQTAFKSPPVPLCPVPVCPPVPVCSAPFRNDIAQHKYALPRSVAGSEVTDDIEIEPSEVTEIEPSEVTEILPNCGEHKNVIEIIELLSEGRRSLLYSSPLTEIKTPMENTVLHIAARNGKDDIVDLVVERAPNLLFSFNKNDDSALHVAARAGHITTVKKLLAAYANYQRPEIAEAWEKYKSSADLNTGMIGMQDLLGLVKKENDKGNTMLHEAMICGNSVGAMIFKAFEPYNIENSSGERESLLESCKEFAFIKTNNAKKSVLYLAVEAADKEAVELILEHECPYYREPVGLSPVVASITKRDKDMLSIVLRMKPDWIHLADKHGRLPLHYAASTGYFEGVELLLGKYNCCVIQRDIYGYFPIHLTSQGGHVDVVKVLLGYCLDPATEMLDNSRRNILHIAAKSGKHEVVRYILRTPKLHEMINQKDNKGDTPLHLATRSCHPKTVYYLTWDKRVELGLVNYKNETSLDIVNALYQLNNSSMRQQLTWTALKSAGAKPNSSRVLPLESRSCDLKPNENSPKMEPNNDKVSNQERYKDRVETLTVVSTLIITASVAACLAVPGEADGTAKNLYHVMFQFFIICITLSFFSSVSATIILFWARLGLIELLAYSLKIVMPLLGVALISLSLAFLAGVYTVISKLHWLATTFVVMTAIFVVVVFLLYILLFLPSSSTNKPLRYISYCPFLFMASLAEPKNNRGANF